MIAAIRSCLTSLRTGDLKIWWRIKSKVNQHWDLIIAAVRMQRRWFFDSANMRCVPHLKKYIEFWRYPVMSFLYLDKDDLERADDQ